MMLVVSALFTLLDSGRLGSTPIQLTDGLAISGISPGGRLPVAFDSVQDLVIRDQWAMPHEGDSLPTVSGGTAKWRHVSADKEGAFGRLGSGYLAVSVDSPKEGVMVLEASGASLVYVNSVPRAGDPYSYGYLKLPVAIYRGQNTLLFAVQRGQLKGELSEPRGPVQIETGDSTLPDVIVGGPKELLAGVVLLNNTIKNQTFHISARNSADGVATGTAEVPAMSIRKVPVRLLVPSGDLGKEQKFEIEATDGKKSDHATLTLEVKKRNETHRETFISEIDGSLQYFGVNPSQKPSRKDALVLTLHGASVEGIGQASAYPNKDWCTLVAPTNRRPYGFDWEDVGRLDALEVLDIAKKRFPHDPTSIHLTGHSMGGHGTWSIGTLYPDLFASIAPSAAWISWWTYGGGYHPRNPSPVESTLLQSMGASDTLARVENTLEEKVYVLHGDADDNVPVEEARTMKKALTSIHADFQYHEEPGAGHWWGLPTLNAACVDWPGIFDQIKSSKLVRRDAIDFTTPCPAVSSHDQWVTVLEQTQALVPSIVKIDGSEGMTKNVAALRLDRDFKSLTLDGQKLGAIPSGSQLLLSEGAWKVGEVMDGNKSPENSGPFKNVYRNRFVFVVGTHGTKEETIWAANKARYDAETFEYRGNGAVDIVTDREYRPDWQRNVVVYGNSDNNSAYKHLLGNCPIKFAQNSVKVGDRIVVGQDLAGLLVYPHKTHGKWFLVGAVTGTGIVGLRTTDRLGLFSSGVAYPDWMVLSADVLKVGTKGIRACGFFGNDWSLDKTQTTWNQ